MPYINQGGTLSSSRSPWRLSIVFDTFWALVNFFVLFFQTMFQPDLTKRGTGYQSNYSHKPQGGDGRGPSRRLGGFRNTRGGPSAPPMAGGG